MGAGGCCDDAVVLLLLSTFGVNDTGILLLGIVLGRGSAAVDGAVVTVEYSSAFCLS